MRVLGAFGLDMMQPHQKAVISKITDDGLRFFDDAEWAAVLNSEDLGALLEYADLLIVNRDIYPRLGRLGQSADVAQRGESA